MPSLGEKTKSSGFMANLRGLAHSHSRKQLAVEPSKWDGMCVLGQLHLEEISWLTALHVFKPVNAIQQPPSMSASKRRVVRPLPISNCCDLFGYRDGGSPGMVDVARAAALLLGRFGQ